MTTTLAAMILNLERIFNSDLLELGGMRWFLEVEIHFILNVFL